MQSRLLRKYIAILPYIGVFLGSLFSSQDADLGWHLKYGEYFFQHGNVLRDNLFSTEMPNFHWANSSWGTDVLSYSAFHTFGFLGITLLGAAVITATFYCFAKAAKLNLFSQVLLFPFLLFIENPVNSAAFRGQLLSLLLIGIMFWLLRLYEQSDTIITWQNTKRLYWLAPLFFLWVNLHGEFLLGLAMLGLWMWIRVMRTAWISHFDKPIIVTEALVLASVLIVASFATFLNPFGYGVHLDALIHFGNPVLKDIAEYNPFDLKSIAGLNFYLFAFITLFGILAMILKGKIKDKLPLIGVILVMLFLSAFVKRYAWPTYYLALPLLTPFTNFLKPSSIKGQYSSSFVIALATIICLYAIKSPLGQYKAFNWDQYCRQYEDCSLDSAQYLLDHPEKGKLLTFYDWGGWLIWNYPQIKPSIDGRMHLWQDKTGYSAFASYYPYEQNRTDIDQSDYDVVYIARKKPLFLRMGDLVNEGKWQAVYLDEKAGIFTRNDTIQNQ